jgi:hypothetical protein
MSTVHPKLANTGSHIKVGLKELLAGSHGSDSFETGLISACSNGNVPAYITARRNQQTNHELHEDESK